MNTYKVYVTTSNVNLAGTDANVFIQLIGRVRETGKIPLERSLTNKNKFEQGKTDLFEFQAPDVGTVRKIRIGHDNRGIGAGWHLRDVVVESMRDGRRWLCECNRWLDRKEDDGKIERELIAIEQQPGDDDLRHHRFDHNHNQSSRYSLRDDDDNDDDDFGRRASSRDFRKRISDNFAPPTSTFSSTGNQVAGYKVYVTTSNLRLAGTDANVYLQLIGRADETGKIFLEKSLTNKNKFEQGKTDVFELKVPDVGTLKKIRIGHDNKGIGAGWHLKEVVVESLRDGRRWFCECNKWLDKNEGDGKVERELLAIEQPRATSTSADLFTNENVGPEVNYKVYVATSDMKNAGTDASVFIQMFSKKAETPKIELKHSKTHKNKFERGHVDLFEVRAHDIGELKKIKISHDNKGIAPGWHLKEVVIETEDGFKYKFSCDKWLAKNEDDGELERTLYPEETAMLEKKKLTDRIRPGDIVHYELFIKTSDIHNAGTDANVWIKIYGDLRKSGPIPLIESKTHRNKFEQNHTDRFTLKEEFFGDIQKIRIGHDGSGIAPSWHLESVLIECAEQGGKQWRFECNKWLDAKNSADDDKIEIELWPSKSKSSSKKEYVVDVFTGDLAKAGTDANVYLTIYGENGESGEIPLIHSETHRNKFERNNMDKFIISDVYDLGALIGIRLRHDNTGAYPGWFCERVEIADDQNKYLFPVEKWFSLNRDDGRIDRIIKELNYNPRKKHHKRHRHGSNNHPIHLIPKKYFIKVFTGSKQTLLGTAMNIWVRLFGDDGTSDYFKLAKTETHEKKFEKNHIDLFVVDTFDDLGTLYAIEVKYEKFIETYDDLHLEKIEVQDEKFSFTFNFGDFLPVRPDDESEIGGSGGSKRFHRIILLEKSAEFV